jgi:hypothetical protein
VLGRGGAPPPPGGAPPGFRHTVSYHVRGRPTGPPPTRLSDSYDASATVASAPGSKHARQRAS